MKKMSVMQEYYICAVNEKGKIVFYNTDKLACLIVSCLFEMKIAGCISMGERTVEICGSLPDKLEYLKPLYDILNTGRPVKIDKVLERYTIDLSNKEWNMLADAVGKSLVNIGAAKAEPGGLRGTKVNYIPDQAVIHTIVDKIRSELLGEEEASEETAALTILLDKGGCLKEYFSKYEQKQLRKCLHKIRENGAGKNVRQMVNMVEDIDTLMTVVSTESLRQENSTY